jgi:hypothetical protein
MENAIKRIESQGAKIKQPVLLITLAEVTKESGVKEIEEFMSTYNDKVPNPIYVLTKRPVQNTRP